MRNVNIINKIIGELSMRDYEAAWNKLSKRKIYAIQNGKYQFTYSLGNDTMEAINLKADYLSGKVTEEEYKTYCLRYNLRTAELRFT